MQTSYYFRCLLAVAITVSGIFLNNAATIPVLRDDFWVTDGLVNTVVHSDGIVYVGGTFTTVGPQVGTGVVLSPTTARMVGERPGFDGPIETSVADGQGGWFVAGTFSRVGNVQRSRLARIRADGTVDTAWSADVEGYVNTLAIDQQTLFVGGDFTSIKSTPRKHFAAVHIPDATIMALDPGSETPLQCMATHGNTLYLSSYRRSDFGDRYFLKAIDLTTGKYLPWNSSPNGSVNAIVATSERVYVGGNYRTLGDQNRNGLAALDPTTGSVLPWMAGSQSGEFAAASVSVLVLNQSRLYVGGHFTSIGGTLRENVAVLDAESGTVDTEFDAKLDSLLNSGLGFGSVEALAIRDNVLFLGGTLRKSNEQRNQYLGAFDATTGKTLPWGPSVNNRVYALTVSGESLFAGGIFTSINTIKRMNLAAFNLNDGRVTDWVPQADAEVISLAVADNQIFVGGQFTNLNGTFRRRLGSIHRLTGELSEWAPNPDLRVNTLSIANGRLYVGGAFKTIAKVNQLNFAAFDLSDLTLTSWNPTPSKSGTITDLLATDNGVYAMGLFVNLSGVNRRRLAKLDLDFGSPLELDPGPNGISFLESMALAGDRFYFGGSFTSAFGVEYMNVGAINTVSGLPEDWKVPINGSIYAIAATDETVFLGGSFSSVGSAKHNDLVAVDAQTGEVLNWKPDPLFVVTTLTIDQDHLFVGGAFAKISDQFRSGLAVYSLKALPVLSNIGRGSVRRTANGDLEFELTGNIGADVRIQSSPDLDQWSDWRTVQLVSPTQTHREPLLVNQRSLFFRVAR